MPASLQTMEPWPMYIGGEWVRAAAQQVVMLPYDGGPVGVCHKADAGLVERAIGQARHGARAMRRLTNYERAARQFEVGGVIINDVPMFRADHMPYGGVKESGTGREGPKHAAEERSEIKIICWRV